MRELRTSESPTMDGASDCGIAGIVGEGEAGVVVLDDARTEPASLLGNDQELLVGLDTPGAMVGVEDEQRWRRPVGRCSPQTLLTRREQRVVLRVVEY